MTVLRFLGRRGTATVLACVLSTTGVGAVAAPAVAAGCTGPVRYAPTTNAVYLTGGGSFTPSRIRSLCPVAPLRPVDAAGGTWQLDADLVVQDGSTLVLRGSRAGGDVDTLRIRSLASNKATEVQQIMAAYGTIDIDSTAITSWDPTTGGPDTTVALPAGHLSTDRGRAFVRALSTLAPDGTTARQSTMNIRNSRLSYLGYYGGEAYGVTYKARGCDRNHLPVCRQLTVTGQQVDSTFDHNYFGTYTWGANGMVFRGNTYADNIRYGLDPHDVSSNLTITGNRFSYNGSHGLICSQLCDNLTITGNTADHNGVRPTDAPDPGDDPHDGLTHGIMLHRGVTHATVADNTVTDQTRGAGISIFDSVGNTVAGNRLARNMYGIRLTVGAADNIITDNTVTDSPQNAILLMPGSDPAVYSTRSGRPTGNLFADNIVTGTGNYGIRLVSADRNTIRGGSMAQLARALQFTTAVDNTVEQVRLPARQPVAVTGTTAVRSTLHLGVPRDAVVVKADANSTVTYR